MTETELNITANDFSLAKHNATITIVSPVTGDHRTFRIRTIQRGDLKGRRIVELLVGPDNGNDFRGFGSVDEDGSIKVWKRFHGDQNNVRSSGGFAPRSLYEKFADLLCYPEKWQAKGVRYAFALRCRRCGRLLSVPESVASGYGPECIKYV